MKIINILVLLMNVGLVWAQKIQVNGVIYEVNPMTRYPIPSSKIYTHDRSITPLKMKRGHDLNLFKA